MKTWLRSIGMSTIFRKILTPNSINILSLRMLIILTISLFGVICLICLKCVILKQISMIMELGRNPIWMIIQKMNCKIVILIKLFWMNRTKIHQAMGDVNKLREFLTKNLKETREIYQTLLPIFVNSYVFFHER